MWHRYYIVTRKRPTKTGKFTSYTFQIFNENDDGEGDDYLTVYLYLNDPNGKEPSKITISMRNEIYLNNNIDKIAKLSNFEVDGSGYAYGDIILNGDGKISPDDRDIYINKAENLCKQFKKLMEGE